MTREEMMAIIRTFDITEGHTCETCPLAAECELHELKIFILFGAFAKFCFPLRRGAFSPVSLKLTKWLAKKVLDTCARA